MKLRQSVLVVEPSDKLAELIRAGLKAKGFEVTTAKRGADAVRAATTLSSDVIVANASLPLDLFTSTPDYTPYTHAPRAWPLTCGMDATRSEILATERWDTSRADAQPGLDAIVTAYLRRHRATARPAAGTR